MIDDPIDGLNKGPFGGSYDNDENARVLGGMTHAREATMMAGELMAAMPVVVAPTTGSERQASMAEMCGGNCPESAPGNRV